MVTGRVIQFRRGRKNYKPRHLLIEIPQITDAKSAEKFVGKSAVWTSDGKEKKKISGKIASIHGGNGVIRAIFEKGLPGQAVGSEVEIK
jgi:large subunit ribosomal protein L35Ae